MKVLILDQFSGVTPYELRQHPRRFDDLVAEQLGLVPWHNRARVDDVPEDYVPEMCTTVLRADADGMAEVWKYRWDSSG